MFSAARKRFTTINMIDVYMLVINLRCVTLIMPLMRLLKQNMHHINRAHKLGVSMHKRLKFLGYLPCTIVA